jgi:2-polyprenyl-6-methoxyphenol hydroxylase-like FAD-dependent oxidoreductase
MIERANVIGAGRVGSAVAARLRERGVELTLDEPELSPTAPSPRPRRSSPSARGWRT